MLRVKLFLAATVLLSIACLAFQGYVPANVIAGNQIAKGGSAPPTYTVVQSCGNNTFGASSLACTFGSNVGTGHFVYVIGSTGSSSATTNFTTGSCAGLTLTVGAGKTETNVANHAYGATTSSNACTITFTSTVSGSLDVLGVEISGSATNTVDANSLDGQLFVTAGSAVTSPTPVTTTVANDLVIGGFIDSQLNANVFTATAPSVSGASRTSFGLMITTQTQSTAGSVAPGATYGAASSFVEGIVAVKP